MNMPESDEEKWNLLARHERLGEILLKLGKINLKQLDELMQEKINSDKQFGELIVAKGIMSKAEIESALKLQEKAEEEFVESVEELKDKLK